jgi:DNA-binding response OmpR family regulator
MPQLDGMEVLARLRVMAPDTKFIFLTAYGTSESYLQGIDLGARDMLLKPFRTEELLRVVQHLLNGAATQA